MTPERWQQVKDILNTALELRGDERTTFLAEVCDGDPSLRDEVDSLIQSYEEADQLLETPAVEPPLPPPKPGPREIGMRVGPYKIVAQIAKGGMGAVFRAVRADREFDQVVAIKILRRAMDHDFLIRRFKHERQILAALDHPNIAKLLDGGTTDDGLPYFVMEFIHGKPIDEYCDERRLSTEARLRLFRIVLSAIQCAHDAGVIHRDIKPGNILITPDGVPKVIDFGIAKIHNPDLVANTIQPTITVERAMTPEYASPEQVRGEPATAATDVYSLGILLYELLTGHRPYQIKGRAPHEIAQAICETEPQKPSTAVNRVETITRVDSTRVKITPEKVSQARASEPEKLRRTLAGDLDTIVLMAMRKEPTRRYLTIDDFSDDIRRYLEGHPIKARPDTISYRASKFIQRHKADLAIVGIAAPLLAGLILTALYFSGAGFRKQQPPNAVPRSMTALPGNETQPWFSPDGKQIAFVWTGEANDNFDIYTRPLGGGPDSVRRITTNPADDTSPAWSPDGARIAFIRTQGIESSIYVAPLNGGVHAKITDLHLGRPEAGFRQLAWSPDGKYIAVGDKSRDEEPFAIYLVEARSSQRRKFTSPPPGIVGDALPAFSPDGSMMAFVRGRSSGVEDIYTVPVAGGEPHRVTNDERSVSGITWSPDGLHIVFSSNRLGTGTLWRIPAAGGQPQRIEGTGDNTSDPTYSSESRQLAYAQMLNDTNIWRIEIVPGSTRTIGFPRQLIASSFYDAGPQYSPDGKRIAFRSGRSGSNEIWVANADGLQARQLTHFNGPLTGSPRWSPDGKQIVFDSRPTGIAGIYVVEAEGGNPRALVLDENENVVPSWSQDGKWIYFSSNRAGAVNIWKVRLPGGVPVQVTRFGGFSPFESPDGKSLYYAKGRSIPGLWRVPVNGGREEEVLPGLKGGFWGSWALTRFGIYYVDRNEQTNRFGIFYVPLNSRAGQRVMEIDKPARMASATFAVSPDGRFILYTQVDQSGSDLMVLQ